MKGLVRIVVCLFVLPGGCDVMTASAADSRNRPAEETFIAETPEESRIDPAVGSAEEPSSAARQADDRTRSIINWVLLVVIAVIGIRVMRSPKQGRG